MTVIYYICAGLCLIGVLMSFLSLLIGAAGSRHTDDFYNATCILGTGMAIVFGMLAFGVKQVVAP